MKNIILMLIAVFALSACGSRTVKVLDANWTSMKHAMPPAPGAKLMKIANVQTEYCLNSWSGSFGLMDEAVKKAENDYNIDYVKYPAFTQTVGQFCVQLAGEGYRIVN
jgi:hypothetical protein